MRNVDPTGRTPPCRASPFRTAPIPCSRTPKWMLRAPQLPAATSPPCLKTTFVEVARSADQLGELRRDGVQHLSRRDARRLGVGGGGRKRRQSLVPALGQAAGEPAPELRRELRVGLPVGVVFLRPLGFEP